MLRTLLVFLLATAASASTDGIRCRGRVTGPSNLPLSGVHVYLEDEARFTDPAAFETETDEKGNFTLSATTAPKDKEALLIADADGYKSAQLSVPVHLDNIVEIHLVPATSSGDSLIVLK